MKFNIPNLNPKKIYKENKKTLIFQFTSWYVLHFIAILFFIGIAVIGTVSYFLIQSTKSELQAIEEKLIYITGEDSKENLQDSLDEILYPDHSNYFVKIKTDDNQMLAQSRGWANTFHVDEVHLNWLEPIFWNGNHGVFFHEEIPWNQPNGKKGTIQIKLQLNKDAEFLGLMIQVILITGVISLIAGSILIFQLSKRNLKPLLMITNAVGKMRGSTDLKKRIPVPEAPRELSELSLTFNHLLHQLEEQFEREKSFVSNVSHELRTPLTAFKGHLKLINRWGKSNPVVLEQSIQALDEESKRMERMMIQMLTLARNEHFESKNERVNLTVVIERVVMQMQNDSNVEIIRNLGNNIFGMADEEQFRQIAVILIENAIRYTDEHGKITIVLEKDNEEIRFIVTDTGIGIPVQDQHKIFDRFYRVDKDRSRQTGGTGLGLSIAKELVHNIGGTITLVSKTGFGSTFTVHLPLIKSGYS
ncbi:sensor histidine kinase [Fictibacillus barbaricus]|uniref:histidine kinase n=1 Tax=Fictibacillus barbaricus TaxID=182136 RepID=A0ABU1TWA1_9BACL|nr:HAMP domain-containing sensor histidine kinase [Fictibacillus barbaricus]MDR7071473.1 signal transduction histidine kinase [Fictibacillus barbaricus]